MHERLRLALSLLAFALSFSLADGPLAAVAQDVVNEPDGSGTFSVVHAFHHPGRDGMAPMGGLVALPDGSLIGTTSGGGLHEAGTIFRIDPSGNQTVVHHLDAAIDGTGVSRAPTLAADGRVYGVAPQGGPGSGGTIWRIDADGANFTVVHAFSCCDGSMREPFSNLVDFGDGRLYGTARAGGSGSGAVWQLVTASGVVKSLHEFAADGHEGSEPNALLADEGHIFGTAQRGGSEGHGTVYRMNLHGGFHLLDSYNLGDGFPTGNLVVVTHGDIYGATTDGALYRLIHRRSFGFVKGVTRLPRPFVATGLMSYNGVRMYGVAVNPSTGEGRIFTKADRGFLKFMHKFDKFKEGERPVDTLAFAKDGYLYGVCMTGGRDDKKRPDGMGTVFRIGPYVRHASSSDVSD